MISEENEKTDQTISFDDYFCQFRNENKLLLLCDNQNKVPLIISFVGPNNLSMVYYCDNSQYHISIAEYIDKMKQKQSNKEYYCQENLKCRESHVLGIFYCKQCQKSLCIECKLAHINKYKDHLISSSQIRDLVSCKEHNKDYSYFCFDCSINLCMKCVLKHLKHQVALIEAKIPKEELDIIKGKYKRAYNKIFYENKNIVEQLINEIKFSSCNSKEALISKIQSMYKENFQVNKAILNFCLLIYNNYFIYDKKNYEAANNLWTSSYLNIDKLIYPEKSTLDKKIECLKQYLQTDYLFYSIQIEGKGFISLQNNINLGKNANIMSMTILSNNSLAVGSNGIIYIYNLKTFELLIKKEINEEDIMHILELKNKNIITSLSDNTFKVLSIDYPNKQIKCNQTVKKHDGVVTKVIELINSNIASCSFDLTVKIYHFDDIKNKYSPIISVTAHTYWINEIYQMPDERIISVGGEFDPVMKIWKLSSTSLDYQNCVKNVFCSNPDSIVLINSDFILVGGGYGTIKGIRLSSLRIEREYPVVASYVNMLYLLQDGTFLVHGSNDYCFRRCYVNVGKYQKLEDSVFSNDSDDEGENNEKIKSRSIRLIKKLSPNSFITCSYEQPHLVQIWNY